MSNTLRNVGIVVAVTGTTVALLAAIGAYKFKKAIKAAMEDPELDAKIEQVIADIDTTIKSADNVVGINTSKTTRQKKQTLTKPKVKAMHYALYTAGHVKAPYLPAR